MLILSLSELRNMYAKLSKSLRYEWEQVAGIGAGLAGFMDIPEGFVKFSPNLQWHNVPAKKMLEGFLGKTVKIDNDANVAALGEAWAGSGSGHSECSLLYAWNRCWRRDYY